MGAFLARGIGLAVGVVLVGCGAGSGTGAGGAGGTGAAGGGGTGGATTTATGGTGGAGQGGAGGSGGEGVGGLGGFGGGTMTPVREIPGLVSITFYERTGGTEPTPYDFTVDGPELTVRLDDPLGVNGADITGATAEYYDVYYSNEDGSFNLDGSYLTISGVYPQPLPAGGGLNLAEIGLHYDDSATEYGNYLASYQVLGDNSVEANVESCIDNDLQTHTTMGNTVGSNERLRLTLGFLSSSGEPK